MRKKIEDKSKKCILETNLSYKFKRKSMIYRNIVRCLNFTRLIISLIKAKFFYTENIA